MRKLRLALELGRATTVLLRCAPTAITGITRMLVRLTATTVQTTFLTASLSVPAHGSVAFTGARDSLVAASTGDVGSMVADAVSAGAVVSDAAASTAVVSEAVIVASTAVAGSMVAVAGSTEAVAGSTEAVDSMVEAVDSMVVEVVGSMAVAADTGAVTGKTPSSKLEVRNGWQYPLSAVFVFSGS
jgi:hypothetical protein